MLDFQALKKLWRSAGFNTPAFYNSEPFNNRFYAILLYKLTLLHFGIISN